MVERRYCVNQDRIDNFPNIETALSECKKDGFCQFVYDPNCDGRGNAFSCNSPDVDFLGRNEYHCVYSKSNQSK